MPKSFSNYDDVRGILDQAIETRGGTVKCDSHGQAVQLRHRMNQFRMLHRDEMQEIYPYEDPRHGRSIYDTLIFRIAVNSPLIQIEVRNPGKIQFIPRKEESQP